MTPDTIGVQLEYVALREEIVKRVEMRTQIIFGTLTLAGVLFGFVSSMTMGVLSYPIIAYFLAAAWSQSDIAIKRMGRYIHDHIEDKITGLHWEHYARKDHHATMRVGGVRLSSLSAGGVFLGTQIAALVIGFSRLTFFTRAEFLLGIMAVIATLATGLLLTVEAQRAEALFSGDSPT